MSDYVDEYIKQQRRMQKSYSTGLRSPPARMTTNYSGGGPSAYGSFGILPPEQNPFYQAAIYNPRMRGSDLSTYQLPSGGFATVKAGSSVPRYARPADGSFDYAAAYRKGYGAPSPSVQSFTGGQALVQGGVANPVENISPQQRIQYGVGHGLDFLRSNPFLSAISGLASRAYQGAAKSFKQAPRDYFANQDSY